MAFSGSRRTENYEKIIDAITSFRIASVQALEVLNTANSAFGKLLAVCQGVKRDDDKKLSDVRITIKNKKKAKYNEKFESHIIQKFNNQFEGTDVVIKKLTAQLHLLRDSFFDSNDAKLNDALQGFNRNIFTHISKLIGNETSLWNNYYGTDAQKTYIDSSEDEDYFEIKNENFGSIPKPSQDQPQDFNQSQHNITKNPIANPQIEKSQYTDPTKVKEPIKKTLDTNILPLEKKLLAGEGIFKYTLPGFENCPLVKGFLLDETLNGLQKFQGLFFDTLVSNLD